MHIPDLRWRRLILATVVCLTFPLSVIASDEPTLTKEQIKQFLLTAKVVKSKQSNTGITNPWRLTLTDGTVTHDASFQAVDEHKATMETQRGTELAFVDSYKYNIAAYRLAELLGIDDLLPVYVERSWKGNSGSLSWWLPLKMDEVQRHKQSTGPQQRSVMDSGKAAFALIFHPAHLENFDFRCEGLTELEGSAAWQVHFEESADPNKAFTAIHIGGSVYLPKFKGRAWITISSYDVMRIETDLVKLLFRISICNGSIR